MSGQVRVAGDLVTVEMGATMAQAFKVGQEVNLHGHAGTVTKVAVADSGHAQVTIQVDGVRAGHRKHEVHTRQKPGQG